MFSILKTSIFLFIFFVVVESKKSEKIDFKFSSDFCKREAKDTKNFLSEHLVNKPVSIDLFCINLKIQTKYFYFSCEERTA